MISNYLESINYLNYKIKKEIFEIQPELEKYLNSSYLE